MTETMALSDKMIGILGSNPSVVVLTGAGVSKESGMPTFREKGGLWDDYRPEELASEPAFRKDPKLVWSWYQWRKRKVSECIPNAGHIAIFEMEEGLDDFVLITQNVDGLHQRAGNKQILALHGDIMRTYCIECGEDYPAEQNLDDDEPIKCHCGGYMRPGVIWFGETLPAGVFESAVQASHNCDLFISVGTSALVYPAASLPQIAKESGAYFVEINPERTPITDIADEYLQGNSAEILPAISAELERMSG